MFKLFLLKFRNNKKKSNRIDNLKKLTKWCYNCARTVGVKLLACSRCKKVFYCSNSCKQKAWVEFHRNECSISESRKLL